MQVALCFLVFFAQDAVGRGELGHDESASAEVADEAAEDGVGDSSHGSEHGGRRDRDSANQDGLRHGLQSLCGGGRLVRLHRTVPKLTHVSILSSDATTE